MLTWPGPCKTEVDGKGENNKIERGAITASGGPAVTSQGIDADQEVVSHLFSTVRAACPDIP